MRVVLLYLSGLECQSLLVTVICCKAWLFKLQADIDILVPTFTLWDRDMKDQENKTGFS